MHADFSPRVIPRLAPDDRLACKKWIAHHSKSFYLSSWLLPARVREASWALYAFCRRADDAVDEGAGDELRRVDGLRARLDAVYRGIADDEIDRAFLFVAETYAIPRALPDALLAGMEMDARGTTYSTWSDLVAYCFRVASTVGLMMTRVMGYRGEVALLRAADLGLAMQLTNIARDVGEDERRGREYLPAELLDSVGGDRRRAVKILLQRADLHYRAADLGIALLSRDCRLAIASSRRIYAAIGDAVADNGYDSMSQRAYVGTLAKLALVGRAASTIFSPSLSIAALASIGPEDDALRRELAACGL